MRAFGDGEIGDAVIYRQRPEAGRHRVRVVEPSFILAILASGSALLVQSSFESFLLLRLRSSRMRSSIGAASRRRSPWPSASASRDRSRHCRGV